MTQAQTAGWYWQEYWATPADGQAASAGQAAIVDTRFVWEDWFAGLADGSALLDLCTGGGALPRLARAMAEGTGRRIQATGVDFALASTLDNPDLGDIRILGDVNIEALPFADATFDAAVSQYGIEYADHDRSLRELSRVLRPGGNVRLLIHHSDSEITRQARLQLAAFDAVMADGHALDAGRLAFEARRVDTFGKAATESGARFLKAILTVAARIRHEPAYSTVKLQLTYLNDLAMNVDRFDPDSAVQRLDDFDRRNAAWRMRQTCQVDCALDPDGIRLFGEKAARAGMITLACSPQQDRLGAVIGWCMDLRRNP